MKIMFKQYQEYNRKCLEKCMRELQDFLADMDPLKRLRRLQGYGGNYTKNLVKKIRKQDGRIIMAYDGKKVIGCIAGVIETQSEHDILECTRTKSGRILELFVLKSYRSNGLGKKLMEQMEGYFKKKKCDIVRVEVFVPNKNAHTFYQRLDYSDRVVDMVKILK